VVKYKKYPTYTAIARECGLHRKTVARHFEEKTMFDDMKKRLLAVQDKALLTLISKALSGENAQWMRLFFEVVNGAIGQQEQKQPIDIKISVKRD